MIVPGGGFLLPSNRVPKVCLRRGGGGEGRGGMIMDEIDTCITTLPDDSLDLFDIVTNVVTKSNSQIVYKKAKPKRKFKFPCGICDKSVNKNQKSIYCHNCGLWVHKSCEGLTESFKG